MSIKQVETAIREMPPEERRRLLLWLSEAKDLFLRLSDEALLYSARFLDIRRVN